jgi:hypothetical protein
MILIFQRKYLMNLRTIKTNNMVIAIKSYAI